MNREIVMKKRNYVLVAAVFTQLCVGIANLWSIFQNGIAEKLFAGDNAAAGFCFSISILMLGIGGMIGSRIEKRFSIKVTIMTGGCLLTLGFILSSFITSENPELIWITYGVIVGLGCGLPYSPCIACVQRWFPDKKGLVTGIIVASLGSCAIVFAPILEFFISHFGGPGVGEQDTFLAISAIFVIVCTLCAIVIDNPKGDAFEYISNLASPKTTSNPSSNQASPNKTVVNNPIDYSTSEMLRKKEFYFIALTFILGCLGGLMIIAFAKPYAIGKGLDETASVIVMLVSIFNACGRLLWGKISDKIGRIRTIIIILLSTAIISFLIPLSSGFTLYITLSLIGFLYGGLLTSFPALTADVFGVKNMSNNYGVMLISFGISAIVSSQIAGYYKNIAVDNIDLMSPAFVIAALSAVIAAGIMVILSVTLKNRNTKIT